MPSYLQDVHGKLVMPAMQSARKTAHKAQRKKEDDNDDARQTDKQTPFPYCVKLKRRPFDAQVCQHQRERFGKTIKRVCNQAKFLQCFCSVFQCF